MAHALSCVTGFPEWNLLENPVVSLCAHGTSLPGNLGGHKSSRLVWTKQVEQLEAGKPARGGWVAGAGPCRAGKAHQWGITRRRRLQGNTQHHFISWSQYELWGSEGSLAPSSCLLSCLRPPDVPPLPERQDPWANISLPLLWFPENRDFALALRLHSPPMLHGSHSDMERGKCA